MDLTREWQCVWTLVLLVTLFTCVLSRNSAHRRRQGGCIQINDPPDHLTSDAATVSWTVNDHWWCPYYYTSTLSVYYKVASTDLCPRERLSLFGWTELTANYNQRSVNLSDLKPLTTYDVKVTISSHSRSIESRISFTTEAYAHAPGSIAFNSITNTEGKQVQWDPMSNANHFEAYEVQLVRDNLPETCINITNASNTTVTFHDATPCIRYVFRVRVRKSGQNVGPWQKKNITFYDLKVNARHEYLWSETAIVSWTLNWSCHYTYTWLVHYKVASTNLCPRDSREWTNITQNYYGRNQESAYLNGLRPLTAYEAKVTLSYQHGRRIESNTISFTTKTKTNAPGPIALNSITQPEGKQVHWGRVWLGYLDTFEAYEIQLLLNDRPVTCIEINEASNTTVTFHNALPCVRYVFRVRVRKRWKNVGRWQEKNITFHGLKVWANTTSSTKAEVSWLLVEQCNDSTGLFWRVLYRPVRRAACPDERPTDTEWRQTEDTALNYGQISNFKELRDLEPSTTYNIKVQLVRRDENIVSVVVPVTTFASEIGSLSAEWVHGTTIHLSWVYQVTEVCTYDSLQDLEWRGYYKVIDRDLCETLSPNESFHTIFPNRSMEFTGISPLNSYNVSLELVKTDYGGTEITLLQSAHVTIDSRESDRVTVEPSANETNSLLVQWLLAPTCLGTYRVLYQPFQYLACLHHPVSETRQIAMEGPQYQSSRPHRNVLIIQNLTNFATFQVTVEKIAGDGEVIASVSGKSTTRCDRPSAIASRFNVTGTTVSWYPITCENVRGMFEYYEVVLRRQHQENSTQRYEVYERENTTVSFHAALPFTDYKFAVRVWNTVGPSAWTETDFRWGSELVNSLSNSNGTTMGCLVAFALILGVACFIIYWKRRKQKLSTSVTATVATSSRIGGSQEYGVNYSHRNVAGREEITMRCVQQSELNDYGDDDDGDVDNRFNCDKNKQESSIYENVQPDDLRQPAIAIDRLADYMAEINSRGFMGFTEEFEMLQLDQTYLSDEAKKKEHQKKNRFLNILPYDHSRVKLNLRGRDPYSDYINASFINGYDAPSKYIAAQGPTTSSINDFWRMIWQYECKKVIMLTNIVEGKKKKCEQYWPGMTPCSFGEFRIVLQENQVTENYTIRRFNVEMAGVHRGVVQYHYTTWPDMGVPEQPSQLMNFIEVTREMEEGASKSPIVVHCSAGVGRTGTFITLDAMLDQMNAEGAVGIFNFIASMRRHRAKMVQVVEQYQFIYATLLEALTCGDTTIPKTDFVTRYRAMKSPSPDTGMTALQEEFELLRAYTVIPGKNEVTAATREENWEKNRYPDVVPPDRVRPYLMTEVEGSTNYINATYFPGKKSKNQYITTQSPLPNTVVDFWRLVVDYRVTRIVMLHGDTPDKTFAKYWPEDGDELICGPFVVTSTKEVVMPGIAERTLTVRKQTSKKQLQTVYQLQLECNPMEEDGPPSASDMIFMRNRLKSWPTQGHDSSPILVHCRDGVGMSATFCALLSILDRVDCSDDVEVYQVCKKLRAVRYEAISHLCQYQLLYDVLQEYLNSFEIYENCRG
ncbi:uncharacterized protein [Diadema setosum]|uniref:uncharacterized protein n=1 Tax=Diadema setosum TaxID=31175 RepID=UPI003B3AD122